MTKVKLRTKQTTSGINRNMKVSEISETLQWTGDTTGKDNERATRWVNKHHL